MIATTVKLSDVTESIDYGVTASSSENPIGPKFLRITDIQDDTVDWEAVPYCAETSKGVEQSVLLSGDIVFARTGATTGKSYFINQCPDRAVFASYLIRVRPSPKVVPSYLAHFFRTPDYWQQITLQAAGVAQPGVNATKLAGLNVPLLPIDEQQRIAAILDQADELRRKRQRALHRLGQLAQATFREMFGDPVSNPLRLPKLALRDLIQVSSGDGLTTKDQGGGDFPVFGGNGITGWHNTFNVEPGTITIGRVGVYCGAVHTTDRRSWVTDNALIVKPRRSLNATYLKCALKIANLNQYAGRSAQPLVSGSRIYPVEVLVPSEELMLEFEGRIREAERLLPQFEAGSSKLDGLFSALQHRAFRGEL